MPTRELVYYGLIVIAFALLIVDFTVRGASWAAGGALVAIFVGVFVRPGGLWKSKH